MATDAQQRRLFASLLEQYGRAIAAAFLRSTSQARNRVDFTALRDAIEAGDVERVVQVLNYGATTLLPVTEEMRAAFVAGGASAADIVPSRAVFGFDARNPNADAWVLQRGAELVQGIQQDTLAMTRTVILDRLQQGRSSNSAALDIVGRMDGGKRRGGFLGLTSEQTDWSISARNELAELDRNFLSRKLITDRDRKTVQRAIDSGKPLTQKQIDNISGRYKDRLLRYRGTTIARNEAHTALAEGQSQGFQQLIDDGKIDGATKRWQWNDGSQDPRVDHQAMSSAPARPLNEPFVFPDGAVMDHPHDPAGGAKHSIGCRCICIYRPVVSAD